MNWLERIKEQQTAVLGVCLMLGMIAGTAILSNGLIEFKRSADDVINVTGAASQIYPSDHAQWQGTFARSGATIADTYEGIQQDLKLLKKHLAAQGIAENSITVHPVNTETLYKRTYNGYQSNEIEGYRMRQTVEVESDDVDLIEKLVNRSSDLIRQGVVLESSYPQYFFTKLDSIKIEMLGKATQNAKQRAQAMASQTGNRIGLMKSARSGVFQITGKNSTDVSDGGIYDTSAKIKQVTAVVNVSFSVR